METKSPEREAEVRRGHIASPSAAALLKVLNTELSPQTLALDESAEFSRIPTFGEYVDSPLSVSMAKNIL